MKSRGSNGTLLPPSPWVTALEGELPPVLMFGLLLFAVLSIVAERFDERCYVWSTLRPSIPSAFLIVVSFYLILILDST